MLTTNEKIKILLSRRNISASKLAAKIGISRQNLSNKLSRSNFSEDDLKKIAEALGCTVEVIFSMNENGEKI